MANASLSNYPTSVDTFDRISDLDENTLKKSNQYKKLVNVGNYAGAKAYLNDVENADLKQCAISAEIVNKHSDAIVAIENDINNNVKSDISDIKIKQNDIVKNINDVENKLGYEINGVTNGVRLTINDEILDIYGYNKSIVSLKRGSSSAPDSISINTPYFLCESFDDPTGTTIGYNKRLHFGGSQAFNLYEACFYHSGSTFSNFSDGVKCAVSNTNWRNADGSSKMPSEYYPFSIEGGIRTTNNIWYPFGYNTGSVSVNAYFGTRVSGEDDMKFIVECTGINISNIACTCGIIKYYLG